jgi:pimeloyl-ACP methyl ester carboxylesterase
MLTSLTDPDKMGDWLTADDLDFYVNEFTQSGFAGPLNYYRNHNLTWELNANKPTLIHQPALFVAGERDGVIAMAGPALESMPNYVKDLRTNVLIPKIGHWTQQEAPDAVNGYLLDWLAGLS